MAWLENLLGNSLSLPEHSSLVTDFRELTDLFAQAIHQRTTAMVVFGESATACQGRLSELQNDSLVIDLPLELSREKAEEQMKQLAPCSIVFFFRGHTRFFMSNIHEVRFDDEEANESGPKTYSSSPSFL